MSINSSPNNVTEFILALKFPRIITFVLKVFSYFDDID